MTTAIGRVDVGAPSQGRLVRGWTGIATSGVVVAIVRMGGSGGVCCVTGFVCFGLKNVRESAVPKPPKMKAPEATARNIRCGRVNICLL